MGSVGNSNGYLASEARRCYTQAAQVKQILGRLEPDSPEAQQLKGKYAQLRIQGQTAQLFDKLAALDPSSVEAGLTKLQINQLQTQRQALGLVSNLEPESPEANQILTNMPLLQCGASLNGLG
ncbi:MAG TPA: hypothetical protein V6C52_09645 [Coleofasciculaceae cyanobacterium]